MSGDASSFVLDLLDRPNEPVFTPKGDNGVVFNVPDDYLEDRFKGADVSNRFGSGSSERVQVKPITLPDLSLPESLNKDDQFSLFLPRHRKCAGRLIEIFMGMRTTEDFLSCATYCRSKMNSLMFNYAMSVAILHRPDLKHIDLPPLCSYFPDKYMDGKVFRKAREEVNLNFQIDNLAQVPIELPLDYTASDLEEEHRVAYFREDLGINLHHWHWHLVYPFSGTREVVNKDRRGELFYYMHQQILARYNAERLCNKLPRTTRLLEFRQPLKEGYFPKLDSLTASRTWASRPPNAVLQDIRREAEEITFDIQDLERWKDRILEVAHTGRYKSSDGQSVALTPETGIDVLGNLIESSVLSPNPNLYGDLHNFGHIAIALVHDPEFRHLETFSVMGDSATAMRDPIFYRWHAFIDDIFQEYKQTLPQYTAPQLDFDNVRVTGLEINSPNNPKNQIGTFWKQDDVDLVRGMDFTPRGNVYTRFTHLQHTPFEYTITVNNTGAQRRGTVRIFLGPKLDERGVSYLYTEQRKLMIELDKFDFDLKPNQNVIKRRSPESSVIIPFERTFRNLNAAPTTQDALAAFNFCGCGWPEHMLIPKGTVEGFPCVLFVMISNFQDDRVEGAGGVAGDCSSASSYCGVRNSKYPDRRPMGYPFDRLPRRGVDTIQQFLTGNMRVQDVIIKFSNRIVPATPLPSRPK